MRKLLKNSNFDFVSRFKISSYISLVFIIIGVLFFFIKGRELGIYFKGGTELIVQLDSEFSNKNQIINY